MAQQNESRDAAQEGNAPAAPSGGQPNPQPGAGQPGAAQGQITTPNPLEIIWEKYKTWIILGSVVLVAMIVGTYVMQYLDNQRRNSTWDRFAQEMQFRDAVVPEQKTNSFMYGFMLPGEFDKFLEKQSSEELASAAQGLSGTRAEPWALWMLASRQAREGDVAGAESSIAKIRNVAPGFAALQEVEAAPVFRPEPDEDKDAKEASAKVERPALPPKMSVADALLEMAKENAGLRESRKDLYVAPEPNSKETVVFETAEGPFEVRFYTDKAPKSVARFLETVKAGLYDGLSFHRIMRRRATSGFMGQEQPALLFFGNPFSMKEDKSTWDSYQPEEKLEFEDSGISHFPMMLAFDRGGSDKDNNPMVFYITLSDASTRDGDYTVFARVVSGEEVLRRIHEGELSSEAEEQAMDGKPRRPVKVTKVSIRE
jgi:cyclophilin family peptidyl-prolyl cis-trans isomerase